MKKALFFIFVILLCSLVISSSVSRSMSSSIVEGSDLFVTLTATLDSTDTIIIIDEIIPSGFSIVDSNGGDSSQARHLQWINTEASGTIIYKYKVNVGSTLENYSFSGKYVAENDTTEKTITGNTQVSVNALIPTCTDEHWTDTNGACQPNNTLTTTWTQTTTCQDGVQHPSPETRACNYSAPTCTDFNYSLWEDCSPQGSQTRTITSSTPSGCQGGSPILTRPCTYVPTCTNEHWTDTNGTCQPNNTKTRTWEKIINCENGVDHDPLVEEVSCNYNAPVCETFTYSLFGECQQVSGTIGIKSRTIATQLPIGCEGGTPDLTADCNFIPTCTDSYWTYSLGDCDNNVQVKTWIKTADCNGGIQRPTTENISCSPTTTLIPTCTNNDWSSRIEPSVCPSNGFQIKYWSKNIDCQSGITKQPQENITCTPQTNNNPEPETPPTLPTTCTSFTYSNWTECNEDEIQTRTIISSTPNNCEGGNPVLSQNCTFIEPNSCSGTMCNGICYTQTGVCCNNRWNNEINSCSYSIVDILNIVENSDDDEAIALLDQAQVSIQNGEIIKGKAEAQVALLKSQVNENPEFLTIYEEALLALEDEDYAKAEELSINATEETFTSQEVYDLSHPLVQIITVLVILTIIIILLLLFGKKRDMQIKYAPETLTKKEVLSEKEKTLAKLKKELKNEIKP